MKTNRIAALTVCVVTALVGAACSDDPAVTGTTYAACNDAADCTVAGDSCIAVPMASPDDPQESQCTRECTTDAECSGSGRCLSVAGGPLVCHHRCISGADCRNGWGCQLQEAEGFSICLPGPSTEYGIPIFETCPLSTFPSPCAPEVEGCFAIDANGATGSLCTNTCSEARPCPGDPDETECVSLNEIDFTCFEECAGDDSLCPAGFSCRDQLEDGTTFRPICLPMPVPVEPVEP